MEYTVLFFELIALLVGFFHFRHIKKTAYELLLWLNLMILIAEAIGLFQRKQHLPNVQVYNIATAIEFMVYGCIFLTILQHTKFKAIIRVFLFVYPILWFTNIVFIQGFNVFHTYTMTIGSLFMVLFAFAYFYSLLQEDKALNLLKTPAFWLCTGILFFYAGDMFNSVTVKYTNRIKIPLLETNLFRLINNTLNVILYTCYILTYKCSTKENKL